MSNELNVGPLQMHILWLISKEPMHGYQMMSRLAKSGKKIEQGTLYPTIQKLEDAGLIRVSANGARGKKIYSVTRKGLKTMEKTCQDFATMFQEIFRDFVCTSCKSGKCLKCGGAQNA